MQDQNQILALQEMAETSTEGPDGAEAGYTHVTSAISIFSDCMSVSIRTL